MYFGDIEETVLFTGLAIFFSQILSKCKLKCLCYVIIYHNRKLHSNHQSFLNTEVYPRQRYKIISVKIYFNFLHDLIAKPHTSPNNASTSCQHYFHCSNDRGTIAGNFIFPRDPDEKTEGTVKGFIWYRKDLTVRGGMQCCICSK